MAAIAGFFPDPVLKLSHFPFRHEGPACDRKIFMQMFHSVDSYYFRCNRHTEGIAEAFRRSQANIRDESPLRIATAEPFHSDDPNIALAADRQDLVLEAAIDTVHDVDRQLDSVPFEIEIEHGFVNTRVFVASKAKKSYFTRLSGFDCGAKTALFNDPFGIVIPVAFVELPKIEVVGLQTRQRFVETAHGSFVVAIAVLRHEEDFVALAIHCKRPSHDVFRHAVEIIPGIVEERETFINCRMHDADRFRFVFLRRSSDVPSTQTENGDFDVRASEGAGGNSSSHDGDYTREMLPHRRAVLQSFAGALSAAGLVQGAQTSSKTASSKLAMPGLFRGRVARVAHPSPIVSNKYQPEAIQQMMRRGMTELTGAPDWQAAWKLFVEPGDVVGIKVNPVGAPHVISDATVVREIIAGLESAGVKRRDIVVYDRYHDQFFSAGFDKWLPEGVRVSYAAKDYENVQQTLEGYDKDHGYDADHYMDMALVLPGQDLSNLTARRSYASRFITKEVNKLINLPVLKDHQSAGVTLALKNLSHGLVNNVCRSHSTNSLNTCGAFIPAVVAMPAIRNKTVLNILDGIKGVYHGGPSAKPQFVWEQKAMYFATDPVAMDHLCWREIDEKRLAVGRQKLADELPDKFSTFVRKQPEHVELAGALGLGEWDWAKIDVRRVALG